jgi:hypothetical protein
LIPQRFTTLIRQKILGSTLDEVLEALSMHVVPPTIRIVVVPAGVIVLLGLCNPPHSWTGMVGPSGVSGFRLVGIPTTLPRSG